jgi:hypothetical protein
MNRRRLLAALVVLCAAGCVRPLAPAPEPVRTVAVFPANNQTGDPLVIAGGSLVEKYVLSTERYTVADALAAEARAALAQHGFDIVAPEIVDAATAGQTPANAEQAATLAARHQIEGAVLYIDIRRWEPDAGFHPTFIIASVALTLVDVTSGRVLWSADHPSRPVPTPGVVVLGEAYSIAAHTLITEMLAPLVPKRSGP